MLARRRSCLGTLTRSSEPADPQVDKGVPPSDRQIAKMTLVGTVECFRPNVTPLAVCACRFTADREVHDLAAQPNLLDNEPRAQQRQHLGIHRPPLGWPSDPPGRSGLPEQA